MVNKCHKYIYRTCVGTKQGQILPEPVKICHNVKFLTYIHPISKSLLLIQVVRT